MLGADLLLGAERRRRQDRQYRLQSGLPDAGALGDRRRCWSSAGAAGAASALFERDGTLLRRPAGRLAVRRRVPADLRRPRLHDRRAQHADGQHHAVLGADRRAFPAWRAHVGGQSSAGWRWPSPAWSLVFSDKLSLPGPTRSIGDLMSLAGGMFWAATTLVIKRSRLAIASAEKLLLYQLAGLSRDGAAAAAVRRPGDPRGHAHCRSRRCCSRRSTSSPSPMCSGSG